MPIDTFHPAVSGWFNQTFSNASDCQLRAWPSIQAGTHTLISAPTGSGKTLAAFLAVIDQLIRQGQQQPLPDQTFVVYVSPLKALSNDIQKNLEQPIEGIRNSLFEASCPDVYINAQVRTGDTPTNARTAMLKRPPHILVTTPESIYLLLTSDGGRRMLKTVHTVIVDEIHAIVGSKRGAHLALSLERLQALTQKPLLRIGLSATQRPIDAVARFLVGKPGTECNIVDGGHRRQLDLNIEVPQTAPLEALMSADASREMYDRLTELIKSHRTTLIFVNTRRMAERVARFLSERLSSDEVTSHHGSLAREQRLDAENRLKNGQLKALVATASLELGIDIGDIDLVCQIGTTGAIATLLQRIGRAGHHAGGIPKGRLFPQSRDDLIQCLALMDAIRRDELDILRIPPQPVDVLAQQIIAMVSSDEWQEDALFELVRQAYPYHQLQRDKFEEILEMLAEGFVTQKGRRGAYLYRDRINHRLTARKGARLTAITCGGAIPDNADYRVIVEPNDEFIGTVDEDFAIESLAGDIFQLGNSSWKVLRVEAGNLRVLDAENQPPSIPFWFGEAPGRSWETSMAVSRLREEIAERSNPEDASDNQVAQDWIQNTLAVSPSVARQAVNYIASAQTSFGCMPGINTLVLERFFDESGGMQLILHTPFGSSVNRAWGLALRKRFCRSFNFELQAAATENSVLLSLGTSQSFSLAEVARYLNSKTVRDILIQALLDAPMFTIRWRWNATCSLAIRRFQAGKKAPPYLVRMQAEDLVTSVFPDQLACLENIAGDREIPDHPLVQQTIEDCLTEAMDIEHLIRLIESIESGHMRVVACDTMEPSPFAAEILTARNYNYLDGAPAEERRTRAVTSRRWLDPGEAKNLTRLDPALVAELCNEIWPTADSPDELHDALLNLGFIQAPEEIENHWPTVFQTLRELGRATEIHWPNGQRWWVAAEQLPDIRLLLPENCQERPPLSLPDHLTARAHTADEALCQLVAARMRAKGPSSSNQIATWLNSPVSAVEQALIQLENRGSLIQGHFLQGDDAVQWCERPLLSRIHQRSIQGKRKTVTAVSTTSFIQFLLRWQHLHPETRLNSADALPTVIEQLEAFEAAAYSWENNLLPSRLELYQPEWLDQHCQSGKLVWARLSPCRKGSTTARNSLLAFMLRRNRQHWLLPQPENDAGVLSGSACRILELLSRQGALFFDELQQQCRMLKTQLENALAELVAHGLISCDSFIGMRVLMTPDIQRRGRLRHRWEMDDAGRWSLLPQVSEHSDASSQQQSLEHQAWILLRRYGVMFRNLLHRESMAPPWHDLLTVYRRLEARGEIRGGRFVESQYGEQFALPEAVEGLRRSHLSEPDNSLVVVSGADPVNLIGQVLPGDKLPALPGNRLVYFNGDAVAQVSAGKTRFLKKLDSAMQWEIEHLLKLPGNNPKNSPRPRQSRFSR